MKDTHTHTGDKVPRPISSEEAQKGEPSPDPVLERPDPATETIDKAITPTSIKELEEQTRAIEQQTVNVEKRLNR
ncbi:hypothetical protein [Pseudomonas putida]|uniref:hypothetical protein n=1 Tax=Pseudomonas putida TaxID=303 RepID=UPI0018ABF273|nr:hypothetical protein [Pseudomonas putida]MBF8658294.1 hypothetical protein [Pseudomonas putida]